ncbi:MAG TPA: S41 family peptidase [Candidatus Limnocylindrales bacterium]
MSGAPTDPQPPDADREPPPSLSPLPGSTVVTPAPGSQAPPPTSGGKPIVLGLILIVVLAFGAGVAADRSGMFGAATTEEPTPAGPTLAPGATIGPGASVPPDAPADVGLLWEAIELIRDNYVDRSVLEPTSNLTYGMLDGLIRSLGDPGHSSFMTPDQVKAANEDLSGSFSGIGAFLGERAGAPIIISVISGSPADRAGLRSGDSIVEIDGEAASELSVEDVVSRVRGPAGTTVRVTVIHPGEATPIEVPIVRDVIEVPPVDWAMVPGTTTAMVRIVQFSEGTAAELQTALAEAKADGATAIVLDLRNNPGGLVDEAVGVGSTFIPEGVVYIRQDADGEQIPVMVNDQPRTDLPMAVLIDYGSASSAEIVTGALQDHDRAQAIGTRTYGTGTVLNEFSLSDGSAIRLGVEQWLTPKGRHIFPSGIDPDIEVTLDTDVLPLEPVDLDSMTPAELAASGDAQLLRALEELGQAP